jgi:hypothetical protein
MGEINYFKIYFTMQDDVADNVRGVLMWHVLFDC